MKLYQVVLKDLSRRKKRVLYTSFGVIIGITTLVAILTVAVAGEAKIYDELNKYGPNLVVTPAINDVGMQVGSLNLGNIAVGDNYIDQEKLPQIRQIADSMIKMELNILDEGPIATIAPKLYETIQVKGREVNLVGIEPETEYLLKSWWEIDQGKFIENNEDIIIGSQASHILGLSVGDSIQIGTREGTVTGILKETGSTDDYQIFTSLGFAQEAVNKQGKISALEIRALCQGCPVEDISGEINKMIPGVRAVAVKQIAQSEMATMERLNNFLLSLAAVTLMVGSLGVINTMLTSVHERTRDIGIMKSVGASRKQIITIFTIEAAIVGLIGGIIGYVIGSLGAWMVGPLIFEGVAVKAVPEYLGMSLIVGVVVTVIASAYPSFKASKIKVADSFRSL